MADDICPGRPVMAEVRTSKRLLVIYYLLTLHLVASFLIIDEVLQRYAIQPRPQDMPAVTALEPTPAFETPVRTETPAPTQTLPLRTISGLIIPVEGVRPGQLTDSFSQARSEGRVHDAIDIMAPAGTPVLAAVDGEILKFHDSVQGGTTIYELSADGRTVLYYAHLQRRADDLHEKDIVRQGQVIAYVGDTGNAGHGNYHLHFAIWAVSDPTHFWNGEAINPYPLLRP